MKTMSRKHNLPDTIIIIDNKITYEDNLIKNLEKDKKKVKIIKDSNQIFKSINDENIILIILKYKLDDLSIKELIRKIKNIEKDIQFIIVDDLIDPKHAVNLTKHGEKDIIIKEINISKNFFNYVSSLLNDIENKKKIMTNDNPIKESFEKYQILVEKASEGIIVIQDDIIKYINPRVNKYTGYSNDELVLKPFIDFIFFKDKELILKNFNKLINNEIDNISFAVRFFDKSKNIRWIKVNSTIVNWEGKNALLNILDDITENKKIEEELRYSQEITQALLNATKDFALLMDTDGIILAINEIAAKLHGSNVNELIGRSFFDISPPYLKIYRQEIGNKVVRIKKPVSYEEVHIERIYFNNIYPIMDEHGDVKRLAIYSHDITDFKKAVEAVRESEDKFKALIENSSDGVVIINKNGIIEYSTITIEKVLGYKPNEVLGVSFFNYIHNDDIERVKKDLNKIFAEVYSIGSMEFKALHKDGIWIHMEAIGSNLFNNPIINGVVITFRDITERKLAEENLNIYKHIVSSSSDQMAFINKKHEILAANNSFLRAFKNNNENIVGKKLEEIFGYEEFNENLAEYCNKCFSGMETSFEKWYDFPILGKKYIIFTMYPYMENIGQIIGIVINIRDITERVQMEMDIVNLQEKEQQKIGVELHDGLSHYLLGIAIRSRMLSEKLRKKNEDDEKEAKEIENQINKAIEETRNLARGLFFVELEDENIKTLLKNIKNNIETRYKINCFIEIDKSIEKIENNVISQFFYIIQEAVNNSVKHSKAKNININIKDENNYLCLTIKDDGIGLPINLNTKAGMGINIMKYRARIIGASFNISKGESVGTEVRCKLNKTLPGR